MTQAGLGCGPLLHRQGLAGLIRRRAALRSLPQDPTGRMTAIFKKPPDDICLNDHTKAASIVSLGMILKENY